MQSTAAKSDAGRELLVLGILRRQPLSAYAVDHAVRHHSPLYRPLGQGNIYHLLEKLAKAGYLYRRTAKATRGPSENKSVFSLSASGEARFLELLHGVLNDLQASDSALEVAVVLLGQFPRNEAMQVLQRRDSELQVDERRIRRLFGDVEKRSGPGSLAALHALGRMQGERHFVRAALKHLQNARWHGEWV